MAWRAGIIFVLVSTGPFLLWNANTLLDRVCIIAFYLLLLALDRLFASVRRDRAERYVRARRYPDAS